MEKKYINGLDGLRAIAIMMVFFYHLQLPFAKGGLLGVPIFFVLSGYLITRNMTKEISETGTFNFINFWKKRIARLFPLVLTVTSFAIIMTAIVNRVAFTKGCKDLLSSIFFYNNWWQIINKVSYFESAGAPSPLTHFWALAVEIQFYLIFPFVVFIISKLPNREKKTLYCASALAIVSAILMGVMFHPEDDPSRVYYGTDTRIFSFLFGAILDLLTGTYRINVRYPKTLSDFIGIPAMISLIVCMCIWDGHSKWLYWGGYVLISLLAVLVIHTVLDNNKILAKILACKPLKWIGDRSYSIYLWHYVVIITLTGGIKAKWWMNLLVIFISLILASLGYNYIETPVRKSASGEGLDIYSRRARKSKEKRMQITLGICAVALLIEVLCVVYVPKKDLANIATEKIDIQNEADQIAKERMEKQQKENQELSTVNQSKEDDKLNIVDKSKEDDKINIVDQSKEDVKTAIADQKKEERILTEDEKADILQNVNILLLGDSITLDVTKYYYKTFPNGIADCKIGRNAFSGPKVYKSIVNNGWKGDAVIFELGSNGLLTNELDKMREILDPDIKMFVCSIVTPHDDFWDANNKIIREFAERTENTYLIDWDKNSKGHPEYFDQDDEHLLPVGARAYNELIKEAVLEAYKDR